LRCGVKYWVERNHRRRVARRATLADDAGIVWLRVEHLKGVSEARAEVREGVVHRVSVGMGVPTFEPKHIPIAAEREVLDAPVAFAGKKYRISCVSTGTAHTVIFVKKSPLDASVPGVSPVIETAPLFPERTSVLWTYVRSRTRLELGIWERGVGETLGCGTGACAAAVVAARLGLCGRKVTVVSKGGQMDVEWQKSGEVLLTGDAVEAFRGVWALGWN